MNKLTVTLKQHTPLLHFQPMQRGACLRASEVKPKLDKFLWKTLGKDNVKKEWLIKEGKEDCKALNYKLRIEPIGEMDEIHLKVKRSVEKGTLKNDTISGAPLYTTENYPSPTNSLIMGNIGGRIEESVLNFKIAKKLKLTFLVKNEELEDKIASVMYEFFGTFCFGNRTSKGFGSYEVLDIDKYKYEDEGIDFLYMISYKLQSKSYYHSMDFNRVLQDVFTTINLLWKYSKKNSGKQVKNQDSVLLNANLSEKGTQDRIPSILNFKPLIYKEKDYYQIYLSIIVNKEISKLTNEKSKGIRAYLDSLIPTENLKDLVYRLKLNYEIIPESISIEQ